MEFEPERSLPKRRLYQDTCADAEACEPIFGIFPTIKMSKQGATAGLVTEKCILRVFSWFAKLFGWSCWTSPHFGVVATGPGDDLSVTSCSVDTVEVVGPLAENFVPGTYLVITEPNGNVCANCSPLFRKVTAVADGPTAEGKKLTTVFATFAEVFDVSLYGDVLADQEIEPIFNCAHSGGRTRSLNDHDHRALQIDCTLWTSKRSDGQCTYTDCFVGTDGDPSDCFGCFKINGCNNGCGRKGGPTFDGDFVFFDFGEACCSHDFCYSSSYSKEACDFAFLATMFSACPLLLPIQVFLPLPLGQVIFASQGICPIIALLFFTLVAIGGGDAYTDAQNGQKAAELKEVCLAQ